MTKKAPKVAREVDREVTYELASAPGYDISIHTDGRAELYHVEVDDFGAFVDELIEIRSRAKTALGKP